MAGNGLVTDGVGVDIKIDWIEMSRTMKVYELVIRRFCLTSSLDYFPNI